VFVDHPVLDRARRVGRQKGFRDIHACERRLEIAYVALQLGLPDIAQFVDADWERLAAGEAGARVRREISGKFPLVARNDVELAPPGAGPLLAAGDPLQDVIGEVWL
jgi:hypothetical protein